MPVQISPALKGVTLRWNTQPTCTACVTSVIRWADDFNNAAGDNAYWDASDWNAYTDGGWYSRDKERIDLGWSVTASVDANGTATGTAV